MDCALDIRHGFRWWCWAPWVEWWWWDSHLVQNTCRLHTLCVPNLVPPAWFYICNWNERYCDPPEPQNNLTPPALHGFVKPVCGAVVSEHLWWHCFWTPAVVLNCCAVLSDHNNAQVSWKYGTARARLNVAHKKCKFCMFFAQNGCLTTITNSGGPTSSSEAISYAKCTIPLMCATSATECFISPM